MAIAVANSSSNRSRPKSNASAVQKAAESRASPSASAPPTTHPLYRALLTIGTKDKTMRPLVLERYDRLLACAAVKRRAGLNAERSDLAVCAAAALDEAIRNIVGETDRLVAEAALCARPEFEGLQIQQRIRKLPGVSSNVFNQRRRHALSQIVIFLERPVTPVRPAAQNDERSADGTLNHTGVDPWTAIRSLAESAAGLFFSGMMDAFASICERVHFGLASLGDVGKKQRADSLGLAHAVYLGTHRYHLRELAAAHIHHCLDSDAVDDLRRQLALAEGVMSYDAIQSVLIRIYAVDFARSFSEVDPPHQLIDAWSGWYGNGPLMNSVDPGHALQELRSDVRALIEASGSAALILARAIGYKEFDEARARVHQILDRHFDFYDITGNYDGKTHRYQADAYFDSTIASIAPGAFMWDNDTDGASE